MIEALRASPPGGPASGPRRPMGGSPSAGGCAPPAAPSGPDATPPGALRAPHRCAAAPPAWGLAGGKGGYLRRGETVGKSGPAVPAVHARKGVDGDLSSRRGGRLRPRLEAVRRQPAGGGWGAPAERGRPGAEPPGRHSAGAAGEPLCVSKV